MSEALNHDIEVQQNVDFAVSFDYTGDEGLPVDLTGFKALLEVRRHGTGDALLSVTEVDSDGKVIELGGADGRITVKLPYDEVKGMTYPLAQYDLVVEDGDGYKWPVAYGAFKLSKGVSQWPSS